MGKRSVPRSRRNWSRRRKWMKETGSRERKLKKKEDGHTERGKAETK